MDIKYSIKITDNSPEFLDLLKKGLLSNMYVLEADAKRLCPVDTSRLRISIHFIKISDFHYELRDGTKYGI